MADTLAETLARIRANRGAPATPSVASQPGTGIDEADPVSMSSDLERILRLPRRALPTDTDLDNLIDKWNATLHNANVPGQCDCEQRFAHLAVPCISSLNQHQAWGCEDFLATGGLVGKIPVGGGKTGMDALLAMVRPDVKNALLLIQVSLLDQFLKDDFPQWAAHFKVPNLDPRYSSVYVPGRPTLHVYTYNDLSNPKHTGLLNQLNPDLVIADECQNLAVLDSSRTLRFIKHFKDHPECRFVGLSGTFSTKSILQYYHLMGLALREKSPLPVDRNVAKKWAKALDPAPFDGRYTDPGKIRVLCKDKSERPIEAVGRWERETQGVISAQLSSTAQPLYLHERKPPEIPPVLQAALAKTRTGTRPDGEESQTAFQKGTWLKQLLCGFYYFFRFPGMEPEELIERWRGRRGLYFKEVRSMLDIDNGRPPPPEHMDSPMLLENAAKRYYSNYKGKLPVWASNCYRPWAEVKDKVHPVQAVEWIDDHIQKDAVAWADERKAAGEGGIIWCEFREIGERIARALGVEYYADGKDAKAALRAEKGDRVIVVSIRAHHRGVNLQRFNKALVVSNPADGGLWEQLLGRMHRFGQTKPVHYWVYRHAPELRAALDKAIERAHWVADKDKTEQKLVLAKKDWEEA